MATTKKKVTGTRKKLAATLLSYDAGPERLKDAMAQIAGCFQKSAVNKDQLILWTPTIGSKPVASSPLIDAPPVSKKSDEITLNPWRITVVTLDTLDAINLLCHCIGRDTIAPGIIIGADLAYWAAAMRFSGSLTAQGKFLPELLEADDRCYAVWEPVCSGDDARRMSQLAQLMPHSCRALSHSVDTPDEIQSITILRSLLQRDYEMFNEVDWAGVILDEAQNIKNAETKQSRAARQIKSGYRVALTGTPVENNVGDLWAIMEFLNPGFLGSQTEFKRQFFLPIQAKQDKDAIEKLKRLTSPFILRRLKTDKSIISDLPEKMEMKVYCTLTKEQGSLYAAVVEDVNETLKNATGMARRGLVLATLMKLKQICNHPTQFLSDNSQIGNRSGKLARLTEMLEEALAEGDKALIFSQFATMGTILQRHLQETFGREVLFLHGSVQKKHRDRMVERFQEANGNSTRIFILSLKAGGTGLNLTAANHVFHYDRWWSPAVENQATGRAFRIGQTRNVQVHKFLCAGTLEDKIDEMIERKQKIASNIVGTGEGWLTELSNDQLKELFKLRKEAIGEL